MNRKDNYIMPEVECLELLTSNLLLENSTGEQVTPIEGGEQGED